MDFIVPQDAEQGVIDLLTGWEIPAATVLPNPLPDGFIRVTQQGGTQRDLVTDTPVLYIESFERHEDLASKQAAASLMLMQMGANTGAFGDLTVYRVQVVSLPQNYPLPSVPSHARYVYTIALDIRRRVLTL